MPLAYHSYPDSAPDSRTPGTIERVASLADRDLQEILDAVPDAMVVVDQAGRIRLANRQAEVVFGYKRQELTGERVEVLVPEHLVGDHAGQRSHFFEQPQARPMGARPDLKARRRDGSVFPVEINLSPLTSDEGMLVVASIRDISERRRIDAEQRWQAEFSSGIINSLPGIFYLVDKSGHMRQWNANLETVTGYSADELSGMTAWEILDPSEHQ
ncbi:MAG TPA: PAS domain S-box protein, partial [Wenzhouxiangella sp.]|nr:PAS domain S-box protein [Wenzhouxiangella sp.]